MRNIDSALGMGLTWGFTGVSLLNFEIFDTTRGEIAESSLTGALLGLYATTKWASRDFKTYVSD